MSLLSIVLSCILAAAPVSEGNNPYASYRAKVDSAPFIVISKKDLQLVLLDDDCNVLMQTGISCAKVVGPKMKRGDHKTPEGTFKINQLLESKTLTHDFGDGKGPIKGAYGPWFLRLDVPGFIDIGIHGTHKPQSIGTRDTEGCIRLVNDDIERLKSMVKVGTPVIILPEGEALLTSCPEKSPKTLVLYYSQTGATKAVAEEIQEQTGADIKSFDVVEVYDGNYDATIKRCLAEREKGFVPTLATKNLDISKYDVIFLGYPVWFGTCAPAVKALISELDFSGKKIVPFCTFGSGGIVSSSADLKKALPHSEIAVGFGIRNARIQYAEEELNRFLIENGYKPGSIDPLPEYSEQDAVTPEERALYEEAVAGYPYPMGDPVSVGARTVPGGVDFLFIVSGRDFQGNPTRSKVYVSRRNGRKTEFTQVVR